MALRLAAEPGPGVPDEIVMSVRDVHERHLRPSQHLVRQADLDPLTGLANRSAFERALAVLAERDVRVLVAFCDIDDFKAINDEFGHDVGDDVLRAVAAAIGNIVRGDDIVARFGGDEFAVVVTQVDDMQAVPLGARLLGVTRDLRVADSRASRCRSASADRARQRTPPPCASGPIRPCTRSSGPTRTTGSRSNGTRPPVDPGPWPR